MFGLKPCPFHAPRVPLIFLVAAFVPTQATVWAYANGCLGVRKRLKQAFKLPVISRVGTTSEPLFRHFGAPLGYQRGTVFD